MSATTIPNGTIVGTQWNGQVANKNMNIQGKVCDNQLSKNILSPDDRHTHTWYTYKSMYTTLNLSVNKNSLLIANMEVPAC